MSFRSKILLQLVAALVGILLISALAVWQVRQQTVAGREAMLEAAVDAAHSVALGFKAQADAGRMSVQDAQTAAGGGALALR